MKTMCCTVFLLAYMSFFIRGGKADNLLVNATDPCNSHGWYNLKLLCTSCLQLNLGKNITAYCKKCCNDITLLNESKQEKKYPKAVLEFCFCKAPIYPQIAAFVKSDMPLKFVNLEIKEMRGVDPAIKLLNKYGTVEYTAAIEDWNTNTITDFLTTHLENNTADNSLANDLIKSKYLST